MTRKLTLIKVAFVVSKGKPIVQDINLEVQAGEIVTVVGPSGSGKSTLLTLINRLRDLSQGWIALDGRDIRDMDVLELRRRIGWVGQYPAPFPGTVRSNIEYGPRLTQAPAPELATELIEAVGLPPEILDREMKDLSGGEQQRVALARALANDPQVLLLDEITSALDPGSGGKIEELILQLAQEKGKLVLWVTHDLRQAQRVGTQTLLLYQGQKVEMAPTDRFFTQPREEITVRFLAGTLTDTGNGTEHSLGHRGEEA